MTIFLIALAGALFNRIRGGALDGLVAAADNALVSAVLNGKTINIVAFQVIFGLATGSIWTGIFLAAAMAAGQAPGWGTYVGALGGYKGGWRTGRADDPDGALSEWSPIDGLIADYIDEPQIWGWLGLTLRGAFWGFLLALPLHSVWPLMAGTLMGGVYFMVTSVQQVITGKTDPGDWGPCEIAFGAVLWTGCAIGMT